MMEFLFVVVKNDAGGKAVYVIANMIAVRIRRNSEETRVVAIAFLERTNLLLCLILADAVRFLNPARELLALAGNGVELVVSEFAPLFPDVAFKLLPVAFDNVPIHDILLKSFHCGKMPAYRYADRVPGFLSLKINML
jgi:hypothetical protein